MNGLRNFLSTDMVHLVTGLGLTAVGLLFPPAAAMVPYGLTLIATGTVLPSKTDASLPVVVAAPAPVSTLPVVTPIALPVSLPASPSGSMHAQDYQDLLALLSQVIASVRAAKPATQT